jgi:oligopeptide transport system substrate-binding protein
MDFLKHGYCLNDVLRAAERHFSADLVSMPGFGTTFLGFNCGRAPLNDRRVRQAISLAIDRRQLARSSLALRRDVASRGLIPPGMAGHGLGPERFFDPEAARRLLAEAGFPGGRGMPKLSFLAPDQGFEDESLIWLARQIWDVLGSEFKIELLHMPLIAVVERVLEEVPDLYSLNWGADYTDADSMLRGGNWQKWCNWSNKRFEQLIEKARTELDQAKRLELYARAEMVLAEEVPFVPLFHSRTRRLVKPWVRRYAMSSMGESMYKDVLVGDAG